MPERIISLLPSAAEIVRITHDFPATIQKLPILTEAKTKFTTSADVDKQVSEALSQGNSLYNLDTETLKALQPSVIVTQDLCTVCSIDLVTVQRVALTMKPNPPKVVTLNPVSLGEVLDSVIAVGNAIGHAEQAALVRQSMEARIQKCRDVAQEAVQKAQESGQEYKPKRVMFFEWTDPIYPAGHWTPEMIEIAGGVHPINPPGHHSARVTSEAVVATQPDVLIICPCGLDLPATRKEYNQLMEKSWFQEMAAKATTIVLVDGNQMFNRSGPRLVDCTEWLVMLLHDRPDFEPPGFPWERIK
ncbi:hypothetical protein DFQ27_003255 [Actinomortierella ambigua]|uniref:Fe/B12 periplasmic-binding domain-containing protein n=1 Tax=Actinomortierella ambigua TaxID=1343610 RepID=A0A9P6U5U4_9FUNG|nr:hypothetical protein DFQ27_003255 [Actinomortierella ambigua]